MSIDIEFWLFWLMILAGGITAYEFFYAARKRGDQSAPSWIDYGRSFFPIFVIVFFLRSFLFEPFIIPSASLEPSLLTGDFILVSKFIYGIRLPIIHKKIIPLSEPKRGDVVVFHWPANPKFDYIKRVIAVPGDKISYIDKKLIINGIACQYHLEQETTRQQANGTVIAVDRLTEALSGVNHQIYQRHQQPGYDLHDIEVPAGYYFMMGDNRDDSSDSRIWGFMPEENIVGKAVLIWMSWDSKDWHVRWGRLGSLISSISKS